jgi:hypothetical protein
VRHRFRLIVRRVHVRERRCTIADFIEQCGWIKSSDESKNEPVYSTCYGEMTSANRIYLNVEAEAVL